MSRRKWSLVRDVSKNWFLLVPALAAMGGYALIHMEERYIGPFAVLLFVGLFSSVGLPASAEAKRLLGAVAIAVLIMFFTSIGFRLWQRFTRQVAI